MRKRPTAWGTESDILSYSADCCVNPCAWSVDFDFLVFLSHLGYNEHHLTGVECDRVFNPPVRGGSKVANSIKWAKMLTFLLVVVSHHMIAHFFQLNERNNFYFLYFFLKSIFTLLEGILPPKWAIYSKISTFSCTKSATWLCSSF